MLRALRLVIGAGGALLVALGLVLLASGGILSWSGIQLVILGSLGVMIAPFERRRYQTRRDEVDRQQLLPTDERFIDPSTGERTRVWINPASGERSYLPDGESPGD